MSAAASLRPSKEARKERNWYAQHSTAQTQRTAPAAEYVGTHEKHLGLPPALREAVSPHCILRKRKEASLLSPAACALAAPENHLLPLLDCFVWRVGSCTASGYGARAPRYSCATVA